jgi:hypothetical protein
MQNGRRSRQFVAPHWKPGLALTKLALPSRYRIRLHRPKEYAMNHDLASRTFFATIVAALAGAATLGLYEEMAQTGAESTAMPQVVKLERVVVVGKRAPLGGEVLLAAGGTGRVVEQLPRVVIEGRSSAPADTRIAAAATARCVTC